MRQELVFTRHSRKTILMLLVFFVSLANTRCFATLINYEKNLALEQTMKYDAEYNGGNLAISSQSKAEEVVDTTSSSIPFRIESREKTSKPLIENSLDVAAEKYELHNDGFPGSEPLLQESLSGYSWVFLWTFGGCSALVLLGAIAYSVMVRMKRPR